jgi:hypothetical protein
MNDTINIVGAELPFTRKQTPDPYPIINTENRIPHNLRLLNNPLNINSNTLNIAIMH